MFFFFKATCHNLFAKTNSIFPKTKFYVLNINKVLKSDTAHEISQVKSKNITTNPHF